MLGYCSQPILPFRARDNRAYNVLSGAVVSVYNPMLNGSAAVNEYGLVAAGATLATIYADRDGVTAYANPLTLDAFGSPDVQAWTGSERTVMNFWAYAETRYHLLVVLPGGQRFGIPFVASGAPSRSSIVRPVHLWAPGTSALGSSKTAGSHTYTNPIPTLLPVGVNDAARKMWLHSPDYTLGLEVAGSSIGLVFDWYVLDTDVGGSDTDGIAYSESRSNVGANAANLEDYFKPSPVEPAGIGGTWGRQQIVDCIIATGAATNPTAAMLSGFGLGYVDDTFSPSNISDSEVLLYIDWSVPSWKLLIGGGTLPMTPSVTTLSGVQVPATGKRYPCRIIYNPVAGWIAAEVCGVEGARVTTAQATFPSKTAVTFCGFTLFGYTGTNAAGLLRMGFGFPQVKIFAA